MKSLFLRIIDSQRKEDALKQAIADPASPRRFEVDPESFRDVARAPFAYWASEGIRAIFRRICPLKSVGVELSIGASTKNDFRYLRHYCEVDPGRVAADRKGSDSKPWILYAKGGDLSAFFSDLHLVVRWQNDGKELKADISEYRGSRGWGYHWSAALNGYSWYFRPGLTWPRRTIGLSFRVLPAGCIFADKGPAAFVEDNDHTELLALCAILNSAPFATLVSLQLATTELGPVNTTEAPRR